MATQKEFFMKINDGENLENEDDMSLKNVSMDEMKDETLDFLLDKIDLLDISGGMATITMPIEVIKIFSKVFKTLENQIGEEITR